MYVNMNLIIILGSPNDLLGLLENEKDAEGNLVLEMFYEKYNLTKTEGRGGKFAGPSIRRITSEPLISDLESMLPADIGPDVAAYLRSIRKIYDISVAVDLDPNWRQYIAEFDRLFMILYRSRIQLNETYKVHIIRCHLGEHFEETGCTLRNTSGEYIETTHQQLETSEVKHGLRTRVNLGTKSHIRRLHRSSAIFNLKNLGFNLAKFALPPYLKSKDKSYL